jgi:hypothetical protein
MPCHFHFERLNSSQLHNTGTFLGHRHNLRSLIALQHLLRIPNIPSGIRGVRGKHCSGQYQGQRDSEDTKKCHSVLPSTGT